MARQYNAACCTPDPVARGKVPDSISCQLALMPAVVIKPLVHRLLELRNGLRQAKRLRDVSGFWQTRVVQGGPRVAQTFIQKWSCSGSKSRVLKAM